MAAEANGRPSSRTGQRDAERSRPKSRELVEAQEALRSRDEALRLKEKEILSCRESLDKARAEIEALRPAAPGSALEGQEDVVRQAPRKVSYRVDVYLHEGRYVARVEHLLTKERRIFPDLDRSAIMAFIADRLPPLDEGSSVGPGAARPPEAATRLRELRLAPKACGRPCHVVGPEDPFEVSVEFDLEGTAIAAGGAARHEVSLYARPLQGGSRRFLGQSRGTFTPGKPPTIRAYANTLSAGVYRLEATGVLDASPGRRVAYASPVQGNLVQVL
jgi:hypothetical protein